MPDRLRKRSMRVVGARQVTRALRQGAVEQVFVALDVSPRLRAEVEAAAKAAQVPLTTVATMEELSRLCRVDVPSAAAGILRQAAPAAEEDADNGQRGSSGL